MAYQPPEMVRPATEFYRTYMKSTKWRNVCAFMLKAAGNQCAKCKATKAETRLHVHHLTYERLGRELQSDLQVLCEKCHEAIHAAKLIEVKRKRAAALQDARLDGWATKVYGEGWESRIEEWKVEEEFEKWLERRWGD